MAKMIKFDLLLNGNKVKNLEELQDNFTFDTIAIARSGRLVKWLLSRDENELADKVKVAEVQTEELELFKALASIFEIEYDEESLQEMYDEFLSIKEEPVLKDDAKSEVEGTEIETAIDNTEIDDQQKVAEDLFVTFKALVEEIDSLWKKVFDDLQKIKDVGSIFSNGIAEADEIKTHIPMIVGKENNFFIHIIDSCVAQSVAMVAKRKYEDNWNELQLTWNQIAIPLNRLYSNEHDKTRSESMIMKEKLATIKEYENEIKNIGTKLFELPSDVVEKLMTERTTQSSIGQLSNAKDRFIQEENREKHLQGFAIGLNAWAALK